MVKSNHTQAKRFCNDALTELNLTMLPFRRLFNLKYCIQVADSLFVYSICVSGSIQTRQLRRLISPNQRAAFPRLKCTFPHGGHRWALNYEILVMLVMFERGSSWAAFPAVEAFTWCDTVYDNCLWQGVMPSPFNWLYTFLYRTAICIVSFLQGSKQQPLVGVNYKNNFLFSFGIVILDL